MHILLIDDEENLRQLLARILELEGYHVLQAPNVRQGLKLVEKEDIGLVITDVKLPDGNGLDVLKEVKAKHPLIEVILITAYGTISDGVRAIKEGAFDYITKGDHDEQIIPVINRAAEKAQLQRRIKELQEKVGGNYRFDKIIGRSPLLDSAKALARRAAPTDITVLLLGETGTGKEVFAQSIHYESARSLKPFVAVNCSAFSRELLESEMFGHKAGAFTGAVKDKKGLVEEANGGTLFLDEIGELNLDLQAKMLRFLETGTFYRVGDSRPQNVDVRLIAATNRDLQKEITKEHFREDLFYRLSVFTIILPSLRDRKEDVALLADNFLIQAALKAKSPAKRMSPAFLEGLRHLDYKGNIRELKNIIERAAILANGEELGPELLPIEVHHAYRAQGSYSLSAVNREHILNVLHSAQGNKTKAAELLGIGLTTLYRKLHEYGIE